ncbi:MAG: 30S ribosomal protein S20 [Desulfurivibrionaceae bacterium]|nr:30S ribosomal protein S20 [Desulfurivibrionaceae bacterium]
MANHKSAIKRTKQNAVRRARNRAIRTKMKTFIKRIDTAIAENSVDNAQVALKEAVPVIMKAASKGTLKKENASRKVSRLTKRVNTFIASAA